MARVFVITGPSGVGKGTLIRGLMERLPQLELSVSATTRAPRPGEQRRRRLPLPHARGVRPPRRGGRLRRARRLRRAQLRHAALRARASASRAGMPVVLEIEVQGARQVRAAMPEAVQVFIAPPSLRGAAHAADRPRHRRRRGGRAAPAGRRAGARRAARVRPRRRQRPARRRARAAHRDRRRRARLSARRARRAGARRWPTTLERPRGKATATVISPRIDRLLEHVDSNYAERRRRRQARAPDQQLLPQPRRGHVRRVPAADDRNRLEKLPHDRPRGGRSREDQVPLPLGRPAGPAQRAAPALACERPQALYNVKVMARILLGVSGGIAAYKALELVRLATAAGHAVRVVQTPTSRRFVARRRSRR